MMAAPDMKESGETDSKMDKVPKLDALEPDTKVNGEKERNLVEEDKSIKKMMSYTTTAGEMVRRLQENAEDYNI